MATKDLIAAIEIGSSKIAGMVGRKDLNGNLEVLAYATDDSSSFVRKGIIFNVDKAVIGIKSIITLLEQAVGGVTITKVYTSICAQSFRSLKNTVSRDLPENMSVNEEIVDSICEENRKIELPDLDIYEVIPQGYHIGTIKDMNPVGITGNHIEGSFLNIVGRSTVLKNLRRCFDSTKLEFADDPYINPLVVAQYTLTESERRLGCALIDFGADTTTVSIFHKNILRFMVVLPIGGSSITNDLMSLNIDEAEAEDIKTHYGSAVLEPNGDDEEIIHLHDEGHSVKLKDITNIVEARATEIIANVWNQIHLSGYETKLGSGIIFTGGGSNLRHLSNAFSKFDKRNPKIRIASFVYAPAVTGLAVPKDGSINALIGSILKGKENCCEQILPPIPPQEPVIPEPKNPTEELGGGLTVDDDEEIDEPKAEDGDRDNARKNNGKPSIISSIFGKFKKLTYEEDEEPSLKEEPKVAPKVEPQIDPEAEERARLRKQQEDLTRERLMAEREAQREAAKERQLREKEKEDARRAEQAEIDRQAREAKRIADEQKREEERKLKEEQQRIKDEQRRKAQMEKEEKRKNNPGPIQKLTDILFNNDPMEDDDN